MHTVRRKQRGPSASVSDLYALTPSVIAASAILSVYSDVIKAWKLNVICEDVERAGGLKPK